MVHFKKYTPFSEKRYAFVRVKWQISGQQKLERRLFSLGERLFALDSKYVRYKQRNTVYFIKFYYFQS